MHTLAHSLHKRDGTLRMRFALMLALPPSLQSHTAYHQWQHCATISVDKCCHHFINSQQAKILHQGLHCADSHQVESPYPMNPSQQSRYPLSSGLAPPLGVTQELLALIEDYILQRPLGVTRLRQLATAIGRLIPEAASAAPYTGELSRRAFIIWAFAFWTSCAPVCLSVLVNRCLLL